MQIYVERGVSKGDCLQKIVDKYGVRFTILREKTFRPSGFFGLFSREGVELEFCLSPLQGPLAQNTPLQGGAETYPYFASGMAAGMAADRQAAGQTTPLTVVSSASASASMPASQRDDTTLDFVEAKKRVLKAAGRNPDQVFQQIQEQKENENESEAQFQNQQLILDKLKEIQEKIEAGKEQKIDHPSLLRISQILKKNDFSEEYTASLMEKARRELSLETLENFDSVQNRFLTWIGESIKIYPFANSGQPGRIMALIGPTGVGKTTTLAKLAAIYGVENSGRRPLSVRMITIDAFRIGAKEQIEDYGEIMEIPVSYIDNRRDLRREIDLYREETDLILIDTIGRSPRDSAKLGEMKELLDACGSKAEMHLVLSAGTKTGDMEDVLRQFEPFDYQAVMLTKFDETRHIGNVISALAEKGKPVSYITDGQIVPKDIKKASVIRFLINLDEFRIDREEFEKRFPDTDADQFQWG